MTHTESWNSLEKRAGFSIASIYAVRMLGMFMILPVFSLYAEKLPDSTPMLAGIALGIYGLTQGLLQIPYGMISDRLGRKPVIAFGLVVFAIGSLVAGMSDSIYGIIIGRALQGSGAVAAALMALAADLSREEHRLKMMSFIGVSIGFAFAVAMVVGPALNPYIGVPGLFVFTAVMALVAILILFTAVPHPKNVMFHRDTEANPTEFSKVLKDTQLLRLDYGIFTLHLVLTASFLALPVVMQQELGFPVEKHWEIYLPVFLFSVVFMVPFIIVAEKKRRLKQMFVGAIAALVLTEMVFYEFSHSIWEMALLLVVFFTAFNLLEASLPSLVAKTCPADRKGTAMGVYSSGQFFGAFAGGLLGGFAFQHWGADGVFALCAIALSIWLALAWTMKNPRYVSSYLLNVGPLEPSAVAGMISSLVGVRGVAEASIVAEEGIAYLKVDLQALDEDSLLKFSRNLG